MSRKGVLEVKARVQVGTDSRILGIGIEEVARLGTLRKSSKNLPISGSTRGSASGRTKQPILSKKEEREMMRLSAPLFLERDHKGSK